MVRLAAGQAVAVTCDGCLTVLGISQPCIPAASLTLGPGLRCCARGASANAAQALGGRSVHAVPSLCMNGLWSASYACVTAFGLHVEP